MDVKLYAKEGIEADDIIYTLAEKYKDHEVYIVTKDKGFGSARLRKGQDPGLCHRRDTW